MIDVKVYAKTLERLFDYPMVCVYNRLRVFSLFPGLECYGCSMFITATYPEHVLSLIPKVSNVYVCVQVCSRQVTDMKRAIGIWQCRGYEMSFCLSHNSSRQI